jgi:uncharacterized radical SAM superfamily Fe-S cluster-containing enzyme
VLVPTVVPGVNDEELGELVRFATSWPGVVRGLHLQPVSYFGRHPKNKNGRARLTLPQVLRALEGQTGGEVHVADFAPSCCEHPRCSFRARYWVREEGRLEPVLSVPCCGSPAPEEVRQQAGAAEVSQRAVAATSRQWSRRQRGQRGGQETRVDDEMTRFLYDSDRILAISGMLFQDAWSIDMERIRRCCVQVATEDRNLVPFCLWNVTSESGTRLFPRW